jgi:hypothetical protein
VRRECSFVIELKSPPESIRERREIALPVSVHFEGKTSVHHVRVLILPMNNQDRSRE